MNQKALWARHLVTDDELSFFHQKSNRTARYRVRVWEAADLAPVALVTQSPESDALPCSWLASRIAYKVWDQMIVPPHRANSLLLLFLGERDNAGQWAFYQANITWAGQCSLRRYPERAKIEKVTRSAVESCLGTGFECP